MKAKTLLLSALLCAGTATLSAQNAGDVRFGITGGMNVAKITNENMDSRIGFNLGARAEYNFTSNIYGNVGLLFSQKGAKADMSYTDNGMRVSFTNTMNPLYLEIPVHVGYRYSLGNNVSLFGETGLYFAVGIAGKDKYEYEQSSNRASVEYKGDFFGNDITRRCDVGWGLRFGVEASGFQIHMGYDYGFIPVYEGGSAHNSNFMVGVSYMF